jgi:ketosteroid isomerase-like protein
MKKTLFIAMIWCTGFLFSVSFSGYSQYIKPTSITDSSFQIFLAKWEECIAHFINGDPSLWKQNSSQAGDATIFGAFGGYGEKGWTDVGARYDWASSQYKPSGAKTNIQYLSIIVGRELAYTVSIERSEALLGDIKKTAPRVLRATQIFRKEDGEWKLLHRHADPLIEKKGPTTGEPK